MNIFKSALTYFAVIILSISSICHAEEINSMNALGSYSWEAIKVVFSLAVVLVIFYVFVYVFKKYVGGPLKSNSSIRMLGGISVGNKEKIIIVEAGKVNLLVGVSGYGITKLHQFDENELVTLQDEDNSMMSFGEHIENLIRNK